MSFEGVFVFAPQSFYNNGMPLDNYSGKKNDHYLILYARIWHNSWGGAFTKAGGSSTTMSFVFPALHFSLFILGFCAGHLKI
jgi:hypothetical protein